MTVSKGVLKAKMLSYFREVERTGEPLVVTDRGREVLEIRPITKPRLTTAQVLAAYRAGGVFKQNCTDEDLMSSGEDWDDLSSDNDFLDS